MSDLGYQFSVVTMVNDDELYALSKETLNEQHGLGEVQWLPVWPDQIGCGATTALNTGIEQAQADWVVLAHQDVLYPAGWWGRVKAQLDAYTSELVGVAGLVGIDRQGHHHGHVLDAHGHLWSECLPRRVVGLDEHVLIVRKSSGLRFDPDLPGFHCYGTDICLEARRQGFAAITLDAPVIHLSPGKIDDSYFVTSDWMLKKWRPVTGAVIPTPAWVIYDRSLRGLPHRAWIEFSRRFLKPERRQASLVDAFGVRAQAEVPQPCL